MLNPRTPSRSVLLTLSFKNWTYLAAILLVALPVVLGFTFANQIHSAYLERFVVPELEKTLGFTHGRFPVRFNQSSHEMWGIRYVRPGGLFHRSGFRPGDVPVGYQHGFMEGFVSDVRSALETGNPAQLKVFNVYQPSQQREPRIVTFRPEPTS